MKLIDIKRRFRRLNLVDLSMLKALWVIIGVIIATYIASLRGFVEQNLLVVIFIMIVIGVKPIIKFFKK